MKTITINLYRFSELSDESQSAARFTCIGLFKSFIDDLRRNRSPRECWPQELLEFGESEEYKCLPKETRMSRLREFVQNLAIKHIDKRWFLEDGRPNFQWKMPDDVWNNE